MKHVCPETHVLSCDNGATPITNNSPTSVLKAVLGQRKPPPHQQSLYSPPADVIVSLRRAIEPLAFTTKLPLSNRGTKL
jgi:hypothetical protein